MRRFRSRRRFGAPVARQRLAWANGTFADTMTTNNVLNEFVLFDAAQSSATISHTQNTKVKVKRILCKGDVMFFPDNNVTPSFIAGGALHALLYIIDKDDTDADILAGTGGTILHGNRILWRKSASACWHNSAYANGGHPAVQSEVIMDIDIDVKPNCWVRGDEIIVLGLQTEAYATSVDAAAPQFTASVGTLFVPV